jgi:hypothetical protein
MIQGFMDALALGFIGLLAAVVVTYVKSHHDR